MDAALWLQMRMPVTDLQGFLDGSPFRNAKLSTNDQSLVFKFRRRSRLLSGIGTSR